MAHADIVGGLIETDNSKVDQVISVLKNVIKDVKENGISQEELDVTKRHMLGSMLVELTGADSVNSFYFRHMLKGANVDVLRTILQEIKNVTLEDVNKEAKELLDVNKMSIIVIGGKV